MSMTPLAAAGLALGPSWLDPQHLLADLGPFVLAGAFLIIFAECGLVVGFFLPGDSLLFTAGLFVARGDIGSPLWLVCLLLAIGAATGNIVGYLIGGALGPAVFRRPDSRLFRQEYVRRTRAFFDRYGNRAIVLARFVPVVRTFITVMAGVARMPARRYLTYSILGAVVWVAGVTVMGYWLGHVGLVRDHIELFLALIVLISIMPMVVETARSWRRPGRPARDLPAADPGGRPAAGSRKEPRG